MKVVKLIIAIKLMLRFSKSDRFLIINLLNLFIGMMYNKDLYMIRSVANFHHKSSSNQINHGFI